MIDVRTDHWQTVYMTKAVDSVSWYQPVPETSLSALAGLPVDNSASLIDIGGGASALADSLLEQGWRDLTVLDISDAALAVSRARLGELAKSVDWVTVDITTWQPSRTYDVWHDRAVFHFLTDPTAREAYKQALSQSLKAGGHLVMATFAPNGPERCSGLVVQRYDAEGLQSELGEDFQLIESWSDIHVTPGGVAQNFCWAIFSKQAD
jgi:trans-aconitate methyltransferase